TIEQSVDLKIYDSEGNKLDVTTQPAEVQVKVPINEQSKEVAVKEELRHSLPDDLMLESVELDPDEVTLFGTKEVLNEINKVVFPLYRADIQKDTTVELTPMLPDGVNKLTPEKIEATVHVAKPETKTLKDL